LYEEFEKIEEIEKIGIESPVTPPELLTPP
jgi:hypothetical protein